MQSKDRSRLMNMGLVPFKVSIPLAVPAASAVAYHYKPAFPCRLIDAKLMILKAPDDSAQISITKDTIAALDTPVNKLIAGATAVAVANSDLFTITTGADATKAVLGDPGDDYKTAQLVDVGNREALKIGVPVNTDPLDSTLILEFMPV